MPAQIPLDNLERENGHGRQRYQLDIIEGPEDSSKTNRCVYRPFRGLIQLFSTNN